MVSVHDYWIDDKTCEGIFYVRSRESQSCPICGSELYVVGSRKRGVVEHNGDKKILRIRRLRCAHCHRIHHELPDILVPYKRYGAETIEKILLSKLHCTDDCPCEQSTIKRTKLWFYLLREYFQSVLESLKAQWEEDEEIASMISQFLPLSSYPHLPAGWLKGFVRLIVNSNRWLQTRSA